MQHYVKKYNDKCHTHLKFFLDNHLHTLFARKRYVCYVKIVRFRLLLNVLLQKHVSVVLIIYTEDVISMYIITFVLISFYDYDV